MSTPSCRRPIARRPGFVAVLATSLAAVIAASQSGVAAPKVRTEFDKSFDFRSVRSWSWSPDKAGTVVLSRSTSDDPEAVQQRADPIIRQSVERQMRQRKLELTGDTADLTLHYYLLLAVGASAQTLGQFLPSVAQWGLPPFRPATTSIQVIEQGSFVLDMSASGRVVWRGIAEAKIDADLDQEKRAALLREAIQEILKRFPPR